MKEPSEIWWNDIAGPCRLVKSVLDALLLNRQHVLLFVPSDLPWRDQMRATMTNELCTRTGNSDLDVRIIDVSDQCPGQCNVDRWLLENVAAEAVRDSYRDRFGPVVKYLAAQNAFANKLLWVKGIPSEDAQNWIGFSREYAPTGAEGGMLVVECSVRSDMPWHKRLAGISYSDAISVNDMRLFNYILLSDEKHKDYPDLWKQYIAVLGAALCGSDAEISCELLNKTEDFRTESPLDVLRSIAENPGFVRRGEHQDHVLSRMRSKDEDLLYSTLWSAQLQVVFPVIELERIVFVRAHDRELREILENHEIVQGPVNYRVRVLDPMDLEVGTLSYLAAQADLWPSGSLLFTAAEAKRFSVLRKLRNHLAHLECCSPQELSSLFDAD